MINAYEPAKNKFEFAKCPCCAEPIMIPKDREEVYCSYCGSKFLYKAAVAFATASALSSNAMRPKVEITSTAERDKYPVPHMMTIKQVAETGVLTETAVRTLVKQKRLPAVYLGNKALINYEQLLEFLASASYDEKDS